MGQVKKLHIVLFPWLAFGHMIPYLKFAKLIAQKGHRVSFLSPPRNIDRLPKIPPNLSHLINFVKLPLPHVDNLPENAECTVDLPLDKIQYLEKAYDMLHEPVAQFLKTSRPDWVLYDFAPYWVGSISSTLGIKTAFFSVFTAAAISYMGPSSVLKGESDDYRKALEDYTVPPKWIPFPTTLAYHYYEVHRMMTGLNLSDNSVSPPYRFGASLENCDIVAIRSCLEYEPEWFHVTEV